MTGTVISVVLLLLALQPAVAWYRRNQSREKARAKIESDRESRLIMMIHRQESMNFFGMPVSSFVNIEDSEQLLRQIVHADADKPIDFLLHTPGGLILPAVQIARAIHKRHGKVRAIIPHYAMSCGTLIALACDEIVMSPHAVLGPVDPQLGDRAAASILAAVARKPIEHVEDETLIMADQAEKAIKQVRASVLELISDKYSPEKAEELAGLLTEGHWTHDRPITYEDLAAAGHPVSCLMPSNFTSILALY